MIKMKFTIITNPYFEEEQILMSEKGEIILIGDDYHDKIENQIQGFIKGLQWLGYEIDVSYITKEHESFNENP